MADQPPPTPAGTLVAGVYTVALAQPLPGAGGGLAAFVAQDRRAGRPAPRADGISGLMALATLPDAPIRTQLLNALISATPEGLVAPLAQGPATGADGAQCWFVVSQAPRGAPLWPREIAANPTGQKPWAEAELLTCVLRPVARVLEALGERRLTHRAIRPDNLFRGASREPVTLGQCWGAPPASLQPALYEPPYMALCHPAGRGEGSIADDVYALGVTLLVLAMGGSKLAGLDAAEIVRRKLELGSFAAIAGDERLPPIIADLARGMLAEDPEHRPPPTLLSDPGAARNRRVAARPPRRAQRPLEIGAHQAWTARSLAHALAVTPQAAPALLRGGAIDRWARRSLGDPAIATALEELVRHRAAGIEDDRADATMVMKAIAVLDPLAPLCWRAVALWPDGIGAMLVSNDAGPDAAVDAVVEVVGTEACTVWGSIRAARCDAGLLRLDAQQHRALLRHRGWAGGVARLRYALNPGLACRSALLRPHLVMRPTDLLPALETVAAAHSSRPGPGPGRAAGPVDRDIVAFLVARGDLRTESDLGALPEGAPSETLALAQLRMLAGLQQRHAAGGLPALASWCVERTGAVIDSWQSRSRRTEMARRAAEIVETGDLDALLSVLENPGIRDLDAQEAHHARASVQRIDQDLANIATGAPRRLAVARRISLETIGTLTAMALAVSAVAAALS